MIIRDKKLCYNLHTNPIYLREQSLVIKQMNNKPKVLVIGLDSMPADGLFEKHKNELPNLKKLIENGVHGILKSCHPPITVPAWMVMMSSRDPGQIGVYGFRHRKGFSYNESWYTTSKAIKEVRIWDIIEKHGMSSCLVGVPPTYPPIKINGNLVSCFITPQNSKDFTYPPELAKEIEDITSGEYMFDVKFRTVNRDEILANLYKMVRERFKVIKHLMKSTDWNFLMFVEIGVDRLHHMFWKYYDTKHPRYEANTKYSNTIPDFYKFIDTKIGELLELIDDDTYVLVVSDHGTTRMEGAFCINEWLIKEGYLVLKNYPNMVKDFNDCDIDWNKTKAWGWGGYYGRIFFNLKGREKNGVISQSEYESLRNEITEKIKKISGPNGEKFENQVFSPEILYKESHGSKPDLMVYFENLFWRSAGTIGHNNLFLSENDTGPDDSVHWWDGIFILANKSRNGKKTTMDNLSIYDVAPIILDIFGIPKPSSMIGNVPDEVKEWIKNH